MSGDVVIIVGIALGMLLMLLVSVAITVWLTSGERLEVGEVFTRLFPDPKNIPPADSMPPEARPVTPEQEAEARQRRTERETRLLKLIQDTQSKSKHDQ
ncbi:MAG: hypothetical protein ICCCNLDF_00323 [Planctomycetes bacterium]|nr:hypothetical protein [Planctomycetota bacterium]